MATTPPSGNGGERLDLKIGGQSLGLTSRDLIPVLMLVLACVAGYLVFIALDQRLSQMREVQVWIVKELQGTREATHTENQAMRELHATQIDYFRKLLLTLDHNVGRAPADRYPLELVPPPEIPKLPPPAKEPGHAPPPPP